VIESISQLSSDDLSSISFRLGLPRIVQKAVYPHLRSFDPPHLRADGGCQFADFGEQRLGVSDTREPTMEMFMVLAPLWVALEIGNRSLNSALRRFQHRCSQDDFDCNCNIRRRTFGRRCTCYVSDYGRDSAMRRQLLTGYGACPDADHSTLTLVPIPRDRPSAAKVRCADPSQPPQAPDPPRPTHVGLWQMLLKKSKIEWLQNSRECQFLVVSRSKPP
jgi:hypothetical protein